MQTGTRSLARFWLAKTEEILSCSHMSLAKKLLAYKIFLRPMLIYDWFEGCNNQFKTLEVQALKRIFATTSDNCLYDRYTDIDVTRYMKVQEIRWKRATGSHLGNLRRMLHALSKTAADPSPYFTRACDKQKHYCQHRCPIESTSDDSDLSSTITVLRRSCRLANKKRVQRSGR